MLPPQCHRLSRFWLSAGASPLSCFLCFLQILHGGRVSGFAIPQIQPHHPFLISILRSGESFSDAVSGFFRGHLGPEPEGFNLSEWFLGMVSESLRRFRFIQVVDERIPVKVFSRPTVLAIQFLDPLVMPFGTSIFSSSWCLFQLEIPAVEIAQEVARRPIGNILKTPIGLGALFFTLFITLLIPSRLLIHVRLDLFTCTRIF
ncbi:uncharacterized protein N7459_002926 [Penicillium hispanicum]|uniref:uncharacterized protein n=1 Tax=Penicillium hispanicum TaxID=1080232 RepID=UPI0025415029|nr:uncharacterized protein N7459_002926 [Penicillium hispanicum]KAJ5587161.1 hypothetical protein N7459_002926 [Penicillium hispanicum]